MTFTHKSASELAAKYGLLKGGATQRFFDTEVVRFCEPYVPFDSGTLKKAGGTVPGSGEVKYNTPYAHKQLETNAGRGTQGTSLGGLRGKEWFNRMIAAKLEVLGRELSNFINSTYSVVTKFKKKG
jgi:hypothetical protein